jgi:transcriptional regulator with XRE-family HTH domain
MTSLPPAPPVPLDEWGARVARARFERGLSQHELALASDVTQQTISKVERGSVCPHDSLKLRLAVALGRSPETLFPWPPVDLVASSGRL